MEYTTLSAFKIYFPNSGMTDPEISAFITRATSLLDAELGDNIWQVTRTKRMDGYGKPKLIMENRVTAVTSVRYKSRSAWFSVDVDYLDGVMVYLEKSLPIWDNNVEITYTKGYATLPSDIQDFFHLYCGRLLNLDGFVWGTKPWEIKTKKINGLSVTYKTPSEIADAQTSKWGIFATTFSKVLDKYKNFSIKIA